MWHVRGERRAAYRVLERKPEGKIRHERSRRRWVDNIKTNLEEIELRGGANGLD
jgi:hypothetical protein